MIQSLCFSRKKIKYIFVRNTSWLHLQFLFRLFISASFALMLFHSFNYFSSFHNKKSYKYCNNTLHFRWCVYDDNDKRIISSFFLSFPKWEFCNEKNALSFHVGISLILFVIQLSFRSIPDSQGFFFIFVARREVFWLKIEWTNVCI